MAVITLPPPLAASAVVSNRREVKIYGKPAWSDEWQELEYLEALTVTLCVSPGVSRATFRYRAGQIKREDKTFFSTDEPLDIDQWFVKVALQPGTEFELLFLGRFSFQEQEIGGVRPGDNLDSIPIDQQLTAYGMESMLDRAPIDRSWCLNKAGDGIAFAGTAAAFAIDFPLEFNERFGIGLNDFGNRSTTTKTSPAGRASYLFGGKQAGGTASDPAAWSAYDIIRYLYAWFVPDWMTIDIGTPAGGGSPNVWDALNGYVQRYNADGKTIKQVLDELISRQRGLGWWLRPIQGVGAVSFALEVFTIVNADVTVDDKTLPANPNQVIVPVYSVLNSQVTHTVDDLTRYGFIRVLGERLVTCFTVSIADGTLEKAWTSEEEAQYKTVAGADAYAKDVARNADEFAHVWTTYRIPRAWPWEAKNGENGGDANPVNPQTNWNTATLTDYGASSAPSRDFGHKLLRTLPLRKQQTQEDAEPEFRDVFAVIKLPDDKWQYVDRIFLKEHPFPCSHVRPLDTEMGIELTINPNHLLAKDTWNWSATDSLVDPTHALDYRRIAATVAVQTDQRLTVEVELAAIDSDKVKVIDVPDAAMWLVVPGTIIDVNADGSLNHYAGPTAIRGDGSRLRQIAALAEAFYGVPRATLSLAIDDLYTKLELGMYINRIILEVDASLTRVINTVVTEITHHLQAMNTSVQTSFCELDVKVRDRRSNSIADVPILDAAADRQVVRGLAKHHKGHRS